MTMPHVLENVKGIPLRVPKLHPLSSRRGVHQKEMQMMGIVGGKRVENTITIRRTVP